jgi:hypothetical protein
VEIVREEEVAENPATGPKGSAQEDQTSEAGRSNVGLKLDLFLDV